MKDLINEVRKRSLLWDKTNIKYKDRVAQDYEWRKVAKRCGIPKEDAKKKWRNLRDQFIKEFRKITIGMGGELKEWTPIYPGKWQYFPSLLFLQEKNISIMPDIVSNELVEIPNPLVEEENKEVNCPNDLTENETSSSIEPYHDSPIVNVLITEVRRRNILWEKKCMRSKDRCKIDYEWNKVAKKCGLLKENVKKKWRNLRDQFFKEFRRTSTGTTVNPKQVAAEYCGKWRHFDSLLFLLETISEKDVEEKPSIVSERSLTEEPIANSNENDAENEEHNPLNELKTNISETSIVTTKKAIRRAEKRDLDEIENRFELLDIETKKLKLLETDENENFLFLKSLLPYFEKLNAVQQLRVRSKFQNILMDEIQSNVTE